MPCQLLYAHIHPEAILWRQHLRVKSACHQNIIRRRAYVIGCPVVKKFKLPIRGMLMFASIYTNHGASERERERERERGRGREREREGERERERERGREREGERERERERE